MSDIASRVKAIIVDKLGVDENEVVAEASFTNDLGADYGIRKRIRYPDSRRSSRKYSNSWSSN